MRLWSLHPKYLDPQGLVALWREALLARAVLRGKTRGYRFHPQLERFRAHRTPRSAISAYLRAVHGEAEARGYSFERAKAGRGRVRGKIAVTAGQLRHELRHLLRKLARRNAPLYRRWRAVKTPECHPLFRRRAGAVEHWERGFTVLEMLIVVGVVATLALMTLPSFIEKTVRDQVVEALPLAEMAKGPVGAAWALALPFPADNAAAGLPPADKIVGNYVSSVAVQDGAINMTFGNRINSTLRGKVLTFRPAVVVDAPAVPIAWVCGNASVPDKMTVKGLNRTDVPAGYLPLKCR